MLILVEKYGSHCTIGGFGKEGVYLVDKEWIEIYTGIFGCLLYGSFDNVFDIEVKGLL